MPILLNAIFALSARHLSILEITIPLRQTLPRWVLKYLIPMLNNTATISDETLFAATITFVSWKRSTPWFWSSRPHAGIQVFVGARDPYAIRGGLSEAAFWVGLRQEWYVATVKQKSVKINLDQCSRWSVSGACQWLWMGKSSSCSLCWLLNCCFGPEGVAFSKWVELKDYSEKWQEMKPSSFTPIFYREANAERERLSQRFGIATLVTVSFQLRSHFPPCVLSDLVIGVQHHKLGQFYSLSSTPKFPSRWQPQYSNKINGGMLDGISVRSFGGLGLTFHRSRSTRSERLCGSGIQSLTPQVSSLRRWNCIVSSSMLLRSFVLIKISWIVGGDRFDIRSDQEALLDVW